MMYERCWIGAAALWLLAASELSAAHADVGVGDPAPLFDSVNEDMRPVSMADLIDGKPLVLAVGSAS